MSNFSGLWLYLRDITLNCFVIIVYVITVYRATDFNKHTPFISDTKKTLYISLLYLCHITEIITYVMYNSFPILHRLSWAGPENKLSLYTTIPFILIRSGPYQRLETCYKKYIFLYIVHVSRTKTSNL